MGCLQLIMAVSVHIGYWGSYYSLHPDLRCTTQNNIAGAYYNSGRRVSVYAARKVAMGDGFLEIGLSSGYGDEAGTNVAISKRKYLYCACLSGLEKEKSLWIISGLAILKICNITSLFFCFVLFCFLLFCFVFLN